MLHILRGASSGAVLPCQVVLCFAALLVRWLLSGIFPQEIQLRVTVCHVVYLQQLLLLCCTRLSCRRKKQHGACAPAQQTPLPYPSVLARGLRRCRAARPQQRARTCHHGRPRCARVLCLGARGLGLQCAVVPALCNAASRVAAAAYVCAARAVRCALCADCALCSAVGPRSASPLTRAGPACPRRAPRQPACKRR